MKIKCTYDHKRAVKVDRDIYQRRHTAMIAHGAQMYGDQPYIYHLDNVVIELIHAGFDTLEWIGAGYFHDYLEDCQHQLLPEFSINENLGVAALRLVEAVTNAESDVDGKKLSRDEHHLALLSRLGNFPAASVLKIADRLSHYAALTHSLKRLKVKRESDEVWIIRYLRLVNMYIGEHESLAEVVINYIPAPMFRRFERLYEQMMKVADHAADAVGELKTKRESTQTLADIKPVNGKIILAAGSTLPFGELLVLLGVIKQDKPKQIAKALARDDLTMLFDLFDEKSIVNPRDIEILAAEFGYQVQWLEPAQAA